MYRYLTHSNGLRYVDVLQQLVEAYNNSYHTSIRLAPVQVNASNWKKVRKLLYPNHPKYSTKKAHKLTIGDTVRLSQNKRLFKKGYLAGWTEELFRVSDIVPTAPTTYRLVDLGDEAVMGKFYAEELQKVPEPDVFKIEKILKTRRKGGRIEYLVRWLGYPPKFDSWVDSVTEQLEGHAKIGK